MKYAYAPVLLGIALLLGGCGDETHVHTSPPPPPPQGINDFAMIDSFGVDSGYSPNETLAIDPYVDAGLFEIFWQAQRAKPYSFYLSVSDTPYIEDSITLYDAACGPSESCNLEGYALCQYNTDFTAYCEDAPVVDLYELIYQVPQTLYFFGEVCGVSKCEYRRLEVEMY